MFFKRKLKTEDKLKGLCVRMDELVSLKKYLPYIRRRHNNITSYQAGDIRSAFKGRGMELEEVRAYGYGDDVRDIDWRVTARKGDVYTKVFAEEKDREVYAVLDLSPYMVFGTKKELKSVSAAKLAALLGWQSLLNKDRFGLILFDGKNSRFFKPQNNQRNLMAIFKAIADASMATLQEPTETGEDNISDLSVPLQFLQYNLKSKAQIFIISNYNHISDDTKKTVVALNRRCRVYCVNVYDLLEETAPEDGEYSAEYEGQKLIFNTFSPDFKKAYAEYFAEKRKNMEDFCRRLGCHYINIRTDRPLYNQLKIL